MPDLQYNNGSVKIADDVLAIIAGTAALEIQGIQAAGENTEFKGRRNFARGVRIAASEGKVSVSISVNVQQGFKIAEVTLAAQRKIKTAIETMTGLFVSSVDVTVL